MNKFEFDVTNVKLLCNYYKMFIWNVRNGIDEMVVNRLHQNQMFYIKIIQEVY